MRVGIERSLTDSVAPFLLGTVKGFICCLDDLLGSRVSLVPLCHSNTDGDSGFIPRPLGRFRLLEATFSLT
jgi:hypothetical protein